MALFVEITGAYINLDRTICATPCPDGTLMVQWSMEHTAKYTGEDAQRILATVERNRAK